MGTFNIQVEAPAAEVQDELLAELEAAELEPDDATAARYGIRAAMTFLDIVGDHSVDAGVDVGIEGDTGKNILVSVTAVPTSEDPPDTSNVAMDEEELELEEEIALAIVGQHANPETGDPLVDNVPGHPEAEWEPATPSPAVVEEPDEIDLEEQDNQMAGLEPADVEDVENRPAPEAELKTDYRSLTIEQVLEHVGDDRGLAEDALESEEASGRPRVTLVADLEQIIDEGGA